MTDSPPGAARPGEPISSATIVAAAVRGNDTVARDLHILRLALPPDWGPPRPGQFVSLTLEGPWDDRQGGDALALLRRPFGVAAYRVTADAAEIELLYTPLGKVTRRMAALTPGALVDLLGPLGSAFPLDAAGHPTLIAGGRGVGPLLFLASELSRRGPLTLIYGARTADDLVPLPHWDGVEVIRATDDGSCGVAATAAGVLREMVGPEARRLLACGPHAMLAAVAQEARGRGWPCWVAVEEMFGCGLGLCGSCAIPAAGGADEYGRYLWACREGPVLPAERIDWAAWQSRGV